METELCLVVYNYESFMPGYLIGHTHSKMKKYTLNVTGALQAVGPMGFWRRSDYQGPRRTGEPP